MDARELMNEGLKWLEEHRREGHCPVCGRPIPKGRRSWCSDECRHWWRRQFDWNYICAVIKERDDYKCRICGSYDLLEVHHISPWRISRDNSDENLITVCFHCHMNLHRFEKYSDLRNVKRLTEFCLDEDEEAKMKEGSS